jgi:hypothetical protein
VFTGDLIPLALLLEFDPSGFSDVCHTFSLQVSFSLVSNDLFNVAAVLIVNVLNELRKQFLDFIVKKVSNEREEPLLAVRDAVRGA